MAYRSYRSRTSRNFAKRSRNNFIATILICLALLFITINWLLPNLINGVGFINHLVKPSQKAQTVEENTDLAPPVISIPYEATNSAQIDINGYATPGVKVQVYLDDELKSTVTAGSDGSFTAPNIDLNLGNNNIYGKSVDSYNKESLPSKTIKLLYYNQKPNLDISSPTDGQVINGDKKVTVIGKTDPGDQVFINDTQVIIRSDGSFQTDFPINEGDNNLVIKAIDLAGNTNEIDRKVTQQP